jgi:hypothetical protein
MLGTILPYESEPLRVSDGLAMACEVWFVEEIDERPATPLPAYLVPEAGPSSLLDVGSAVQ